MYLPNVLVRTCPTKYLKSQQRVLGVLVLVRDVTCTLSQPKHKTFPPFLALSQLANHCDIVMDIGHRPSESMAPCF